MNIAVSACLAGVACRWHGKISRSSAFEKYRKQHPKHRYIIMCPELMGGLGVPRPPVKRLKGKVYQTCADKKCRKEVTGKDVTRLFQHGANAALELVLRYDCKYAILCKWSPSCDITGLFGRLVDAKGIKIWNTF